MRNKRPKGTYNWPEIKREEMVYRYLSGQTLKEISNIIGMSPNYVNQAKQSEWFRTIRHNIINQGAKVCGYYIPDITGKRTETENSDES